ILFYAIEINFLFIRAIFLPVRSRIYTFHGVLYTFHPGTLKPLTRIKSQGHTVNDAGNSVITLYTALSHYRAAITG
ncbi:hypothetical protein, partial [Enterobacter hormaechei]|uniref:hypothetical protein n=1 Tax=Enterobacter hormaechei TaxID=158836 RepID=UPI001F4BB561